MKAELMKMLLTDLECDKDGHGECEMCEYSYSDDACYRHIAGITADYMLANNVIVLPCKVGDYVHFKGVDTPCKVSAIHLYAEGDCQVSLTCGKATSTITFAEFSDCCTVLTDKEAPKE